MGAQTAPSYQGNDDPAQEMSSCASKHRPPRWGGYVILKLSQSSTELDGMTAAELALLESQAQLGSTAKAAISLERFCPNLSMAPALAIM